MKNIKVYTFILYIILMMASCVYAETNFIGKQSSEPLEITADRMEAFNEKKLVVFSGKAKVTQGNSVLTSDKLLLYYNKREPDKNKSEILKSDKTGDLEKIEAKGNVSLTQGDRLATGDEGIYLRDGNKIILTGNAVLKEGKNVIKGDKVTVFLNENRGMVESNSQKQVEAVIYPQSKKK